MGFIVSQSVETFLGETLDSFYVRIEGYQLDKLRGFIGTSVAHYTTPEAAVANFPKHIEDIPSPYGRVPTSMSYNGEWKEYPMWYQFHVTESVIVPTMVYSSSFYYETVDYIDFDNDGNEIISQREEKIEVVTSESVDVSKSLITIGSITGSIYDFCYNKVKEQYSSVFGSENIIDEI
jgi:hypothetical protein